MSSTNDQTSAKPPPDCPRCLPVAPLYLGTFSDMAILLMAFFVILLSIASFTARKYEVIQEQMQSTFGVQTQVEAYQEATADNIVADQFRSAQVTPQVFDIVEEERTDTPPRDIPPSTSQDRSVASENALEIVQQRLARQLAEGKVETRIEDNRVVVVIAESGAGDEDQDREADGRGRIDQELIEIYLQVAAAQSETSGVVEIEDGTQSTTRGSGRSEADTVAAVYREVLNSLSEEIGSGSVTVRRDGENIIITVGSDQSFASGSAQIQDSAIGLFRRIGETLMPISGITRVEGHTDNESLSFGGRFRNNWDLSSARAAAVADFFLDELYLIPGGVYITAYSDTRPIASNDNSQGRSQNRRIELVVTPD
jgi:chemotaxis protein MotB